MTAAKNVREALAVLRACRNWLKSRGHEAKAYELNEAMSIVILKIEAGDRLAAAMEKLAAECDGIEGLGSEAQAIRIRAALAAQESP